MKKKKGGGGKKKGGEERGKKKKKEKKNFLPFPPTFVVIGAQSWSFWQKSLAETAY